MQKDDIVVCVAKQEQNVIQDSTGTFLINHYGYLAHIKSVNGYLGGHVNIEWLDPTIQSRWVYMIGPKTLWLFESDFQLVTPRDIVIGRLK
jgi:hypothetical protein